jgi:hypothetical protein
MEKLLSVLLALVMGSAASATVVSLGPIVGPGSPPGNVAIPSDMIVIPIYSDSGLISLDAII